MINVINAISAPGWPASDAAPPLPRDDVPWPPCLDLWPNAHPSGLVWTPGRRTRHVHWKEMIGNDNATGWLIILQLGARLCFLSPIFLEHSSLIEVRKTTTTFGLLLYRLIS